MFWPLNNRILSRFPGRRNFAAFLTLLVVVTMGVVPGVALSMFLLDQAGAIYAQIQSGQIDIAATFERIQAVLPGWMAGLMRRTGITDLDSLREQLSIGITARLQILASHALTIGQSAASFLLSLAAMLYLTFFLLRDGQSMTTSIGNVVPLKPDDRRVLAARFVTVVRATVKRGRPCRGGARVGWRHYHGHARCTQRASMGGRDGAFVPAAGGGDRHRLGASRNLPLCNSGHVARSDYDRLWHPRHRIGGQCAAPDPDRPRDEHPGFRCSPNNPRRPAYIAMCISPRAGTPDPPVWGALPQALCMRSVLQWQIDHRQMRWPPSPS
jgi:hypothetical protein